MKKYTILLLLIFYAFFAWAQQDKLKEIDQILLNYSNENVAEKVFLHLDKPYYAAGEHIWFKAYLVEGITHKLDSLSAVLYVDILENNNDQVLKKGIFRIENGLGKGELTLPDTLFEGKYTIRAYTNWMRNFSTDFFFKQTFEVIGGKKTNESAKVAIDPDFDVQLMPESGYLVDGVQTKVAFKAISNNGKGVDIQGIIVTEKGDTLGKIASEHLGMGFFRLRPKLGTQYKILVKDASGKFKSFNLPKTVEFGHVISVDNFESKDYINIAIRSKTAKYNQPMTIIAQSRGVVAYRGNFNSSDVKVIQNVPRNILADGIVQFTLFDERGMPVAERLVYNTNPKMFNLKLITDKSEYKKREKTSLEFEVTDQNGKIVDEAFFSLAVTDASQVIDATNPENIYTYFFLSSDLKGQVEQPAYYFDKKNEKAEKHLDFLLMTQGWSRFVWQDVIEGKKYNYPYLPEIGINIKGQAFKSGKKKVNKSILITGYVSNDLEKQVTNAETLADGKFTLYGLDFTDSADLMLNAFVTKRDNDYETYLEDQEWQLGEALNLSPVFTFKNTENQANEYIENAKMIMAVEKGFFYTELKEVSVKAKKEKKVDHRRPYGDKFIKTVKMESNSVAGVSVLEYLQSRAPGIEIKCDYTGKNCQVRIRGNVSMSGNNEPTFLLDGVAVEMQTIQALPLYDIEMVDILTGAASVAYANRGAAGVINVLTKRANPNLDPKDILSEGVKVHRVKGYDRVKEFYMPKYDAPNPPADHDARATIYWNPMIKVTKGWSKIEFFNTDEATEVHCLMQGVDGKGAVGIGRAVYKIK